MAFPWRETLIPGLVQVGRPAFEDERGTFTKIIGEGDSGELAPFVAREVFWSRSPKGVFRGMHVQLPPHAARKLVFVAAGVVRDFVVDLRVGSPAFGTVLEVTLDDRSGGLLIPVGCGHGFESVVDDCVVVYGQDSFHAPEADSGVRYTSLDIDLHSHEPVVSERDLALPAFADFNSPFTFV